MDSKIIYVEPEDDITDVISKLKSSEETEIQLSPMRGSIALRSLINLRILARTAKEEGKTITIATNDPTTLRLAATANLDTSETKGSPDKKSSSDDNRPAIKKAPKNSDDSDEAEKSDPDDDTIVSSELEEDEEEEEKPKKKRGVIPNFNKFRMWLIIGISIGVLLIGFLVWAAIFAPRADISLSIKTTKKAFSDYFTNSITFVATEAEEDTNAGKFLLEKYSETSKSTVNFEATGTRDDGEKASGTITVKRTDDTAAINYPKGSVFTFSGKKYVSTEDITLREANNDERTACGPGCTDLKPSANITATTKVVAESAGPDYNIEANQTGWTGFKTGSTISATSAMTGGTTKIVKIVTPIDVKNATDKLEEQDASTCDIRDMEETFPDNLFPIRDAYSITRKDPVSKPAINQIVAEGDFAQLVSEASCTLYGVERAKIGNFINSIVSEAIKNEAGRKVFDNGLDKAFLVKKTNNNDGLPLTGRLDTPAIQIGPDITEEKILERAKGERVGALVSWLRSQNGIDGNSVRVETSLFWMTSIPNDPNKIKITINSTEEE